MSLKRIAYELKNFEAEIKDKGSYSLPNIKALEADEWIVDWRGGRLSIKFGSDYPFKPPVFSSVPNDHGEVVPVYKMVQVLPDDNYTPATTVLEILLKEQSPLRNVLMQPFPLGASDVVYISIGCGGPVLAQQYPYEVQKLYEKGANVFIVLIDPFLFGADSPVRKNSTGKGYLRHETLLNDRVCIRFEERKLRHGEEREIHEAINKIRKSGCRNIFVTDFRSGFKSNEMKEVSSDPIRNIDSPSRDCITKAIFNVMFGLDSVDDDVLSIKYVSNGGSKYSLPKDFELFQKLTEIQDGSKEANKLSRTDIISPRWLMKRLSSRFPFRNVGMKGLW